MGALNHDLFSNIPKKDYLSLLNKGEVRATKVIDFMDFGKNDVAKAAGVPSNSVRYDKRMPHTLRDRLIEWANLFNLVAQFFEGDPVKTELWFKTSNPMLGDITPRDMIRYGRSQKLLKFIINALAENQR